MMRYLRYRRMLRLVKLKRGYRSILAVHKIRIYICGYSLYNTSSILILLLSFKKQHGNQQTDRTRNVPNETSPH